MMILCDKFPIHRFRNNIGNTALSIASKNGFDEIVSSLLNRTGIEVNLENTRGWSPLIFAIVNNQTSVVRKMSTGLSPTMTQISLF